MQAVKRSPKEKKTPVASTPSADTTPTTTPVVSPTSVKKAKTGTSSKTSKTEVVQTTPSPAPTSTVSTSSVLPEPETSTDKGGDKASKKKKSPKKKEEGEKSPPKKEGSSEVDLKVKRKVNTNPVGSDKTGLNISVSRIKALLTSYNSSPVETAAFSELKKTLKETPDAPLTSLSQATQDFITKTRNMLPSSARKQYEKTYVSALTDKSTYHVELALAKVAHETAMSSKPEYSREPFDKYEFNLKYDPKFYSSFTEPATKESPLKAALTILSKNRIRFSFNSKIMLTSFIEYVIRQLVYTGTLNCVKNKKKIIRVQHAMDSNSFVEDNFSLHSFVMNSKAYKTYLAQSASQTPEGEADKKDDSPNFRFYISEICRDVRMKLASGDLNSYGETPELYTTTNVSKEFKDFCNGLVLNIINTLGLMVLTEINTRHVKTLNDVIMKSVIENLHSVYGVDFTPTVKYMANTTLQYNAFLKTRRESGSKPTATPVV